MGFITFQNVTRTYKNGDSVIKAVDNISFED